MTIIPLIGKKKTLAKLGRAVEAWSRILIMFMILDTSCGPPNSINLLVSGPLWEELAPGPDGANLTHFCWSVSIQFTQSQNGIIFNSHANTSSGEVMQWVLLLKVNSWILFYPHLGSGCFSHLGQNRADFSPFRFMHKMCLLDFFFFGGGAFSVKVSSQI